MWLKSNFNYQNTQNVLTLLLLALVLFWKLYATAVVWFHSFYNFHSSCAVGAVNICNTWNMPTTLLPVFSPMELFGDMVCPMSFAYHQPSLVCRLRQALNYLTRRTGGGTSQWDTIGVSVYIDLVLAVLFTTLIIFVGTIISCDVYVFAISL